MIRNKEIILALTTAIATAACGLRDAPPDCSEVADQQPTVMINEIMPGNAVTAADSNGDAADWVELYNYGDAPVSMCGYGITDKRDELARANLPRDIVVEPGGHALIWFSGLNDPTLVDHVPFKLAKEGGYVALTDRDGNIVSQVAYGPQATDFSIARQPDGSDNWVVEWHATPGAPNPDGDGAPYRSGELEELPSPGDLTEELMSYDRIPEISIRVEPDAVALLLDRPRSYVPAFLTYDGREYGPVGLRLKGQNSFQPFDKKPSFRINIDEYVDGAKFWEMDDLTFNNMDDDFSMMHERLAYLVARQLGPAPRANHAVLTVNGNPYGLYTNVETVKWHMLTRWFEDVTGPLFEATDVDFVADHIARFELESGADDRSKLTALADALTNPDPEAAISAARAHVNLEQFLDFWAMEGVIGQFDAFPYSNPGDDYFIYVDPTSQKIWFIPWGMDETFYSSEIDITQVTSVLATTCLAAPSCRQQFHDRVMGALDLIDDLDLLAERERVIAQIAPHVAADPRKPYSDQTVAEFQMQLYWFLDGRRAQVEAMLSPPEGGTDDGTDTGTP